MKHQAWCDGYLAGRGTGQGLVNDHIARVIRETGARKLPLGLRILRKLKVYQTYDILFDAGFFSGNTEGVLVRKLTPVILQVGVSF